MKWMLFAALLAAQGQSLEGLWSATLERSQGPVKLVLKLTPASGDAKWSATLDAAAAGAVGLVADKVVPKPNGVRLEFSAVAAYVDVALSADGKKLEGEVGRNGAGAPVAFEREVEAKTISATEREALIKELQKSEQVFLKAIAAVTAAQAKFKAAPDRWSVLECAEHLALTEPFLFGLALQTATKTEVKPDLSKRAAADVSAADQKVAARVVDRTQKAKAPEPATPTGKFATLEAATAAFRAERAKTIEYVRTTQHDLRGHGFALGPETSDAYQLLLLLAGHTERHSAQIDEVKASPGYPR